MSFDVGDVATLTYTLTVDGTPTDATVVLTVTSPTGVVSTPTVAHPGVGSYSADIVVGTAGTWSYRWVASGAATDVETGTFSVGAGVSLRDLRARLNKTLTVDDDELQSMLDAALAEYEEFVGPVGTKTLRYDGGRSTIILPLHSTVTAVEYDDGTAVDLDDLHLDDSGILRWGYGTTGYFTYGVRKVLVTLTATLPAHHKEAILADVAGYFAATQRGGGGRGMSFPSEAAVDAYDAVGGPVTLFPRIRALAARYPAIA